MVNSTRVGLTTFGAGLPNWRAAARRLGLQAKASGWFSRTAVETDKTLWRNHDAFWRRNSALLSPKVRGFGYWIWKPYLMQHFLAAWRGSVQCLVYLDSGCDINANHVSEIKWQEYLAMAMDGPGRLAMYLPAHPEYQWSKGDAMNALGLSDVERASNQFQATVVFLRVDATNMELMNEWSRLATVDDYHLLDDSRSVAPNDPDFCEHRHDQALLSGLLKRHGTATIADECDWRPSFLPDGHDYPIWTGRNRTRIPLSDRSTKGRLLRFGELAYSKAYRDLLTRRRQT